MTETPSSFQASPTRNGSAPAATAHASAAEPWRDPSATPFIRFENVTKTFGAFTAVDNVTLDVYRGELFALLGGSGSGKTTLLRMLAGFERPSGGRIIIDGQDMAGVPPYERPVNMMFQSYALFPHMTVERNVAFGLRMDGVPRKEIRERVAEALRLVKLGEFARRKPDQLSGGQRQRVALARALVKRPKVLLLDEPLGALDKKLREETQFELMRIQDEVGVTFVIVTHDQEEAMVLSTRIGVMNAGAIVQIGRPAEIYEFPANRFVASFIGSVNLFDGRLTVDKADHAIIECPDLEAPVRIDHGISASTGARVAVALRPEKIRLSRQAPAQRDVNAASGVVAEIAYMGAISIFHIRLASGALVRVTMPNLEREEEHLFRWDDTVHLSWSAESPVALTS